mmetsp:Transcript_45381/g.140658  ORF Transcript_45381/g.140658 Transcript_45381/m.140658 type:complete len:230 (+) Transcript_45381:583-1272(+)
MARLICCCMACSTASSCARANARPCASDAGGGTASTLGRCFTGAAMASCTLPPMLLWAVCPRANAAKAAATAAVARQVQPKSNDGQPACKCTAGGQTLVATSARVTAGTMAAPSSFESLATAPPAALATAADPGFVATGCTAWASFAAGSPAAASAGAAVVCCGAGSAGSCRLRLAGLPLPQRPRWRSSRRCSRSSRSALACRLSWWRTFCSSSAASLLGNRDANSSIR